MEKEMEQKNTRKQTRKSEGSIPQKNGDSSKRDTDAILRKIAENEAKTARIIEKREEVITLMRTADEALVEYKEKNSDKEKKQEILRSANEELEILKNSNLEIEAEIEKNLTTQEKERIERIEKSVLFINNCLDRYNSLDEKKIDGDTELSKEEVEEMKNLDTFLSESLILHLTEYQELKKGKNKLMWFVANGFSEDTKKGVDFINWEHTDDDFIEENIETLYVSGKETQTIGYIHYYTVNGVMLQLINNTQVTTYKDENGEKVPIIDGEQAIYNILGPQGNVLEGGSNLPILEAEAFAARTAKEFLKKTTQKFSKDSIGEKWVTLRIERLDKILDGEVEHQAPNPKVQSDSANELSILKDKESIIAEQIKSINLEITNIKNQTASLSKEIQKLETTYFFQEVDLEEPITLPIPNKIVAPIPKQENLSQMNPQRVGPGIYRQHTALVRPKRNISEDELKMRAEGITATREKWKNDTDFFAELERRTQNRMNIDQGLPPMSEDELKNVPAKNVESPITQAPGLSPEEKAEIQKQIDQIEKRRAERKIAIEKFNKDFEEKIKALEDQLKKLEKEKNEDRLGTLNKMYEFLKDYEIISNVPIEKQIDIPKEQLVKIAEELKYKNVETMLGGISFGTNESIAKAKKDLIQKIEKVLPANKI